jgi:site-specific recombinase XerD
MNNHVKIITRKDRVNRDLTQTLYLRFTSKGRKYISLNIKVLPKDWDEDNESVKKSDYDSVRKNKLISIAKRKAIAITDKFSYEEKFLSVHEFEKLFKVDVSDSKSFYEFIDNEKINKFKTYAIETIKMYKSQIKKLKTFRENVTFSDLNLDFINDYKTFCTQRGNKPSVVSKSLTILKSLISWAVSKNLMKKNIFENYKIQRYDGDRKYLTFSEVQKLEKLLEINVLNKQRTEILKHFLFCCYTGVRYIDLKKMKFSDIKTETINNEDRKYLAFHQIKTKEYVDIPLIQKAKNIIDYTLNENNHLFKVRCNQVTNRRLKEIIDLAEIDKNISFHCSRHTFATIGLEYGISIETVSKLLGHKELRTTQIYAKITRQKKYNEMENFMK